MNGFSFGITLHWFVEFSKRKKKITKFYSAEWWMERALALQA
jgi:hypothetical protein